MFVCFVTSVNAASWQSDLIGNGWDLGESTVVLKFTPTSNGVITNGFAYELMYGSAIETGTFHASRGMANVNTGDYTLDFNVEPEKNGFTAEFVTIVGGKNVHRATLKMTDLSMIPLGKFEIDFGAGITVSSVDPYHWDHEGYNGSFNLSSGWEYFTITMTNRVQSSSSTPEPASMLIFGAGLAGLGLIVRRKKS